jgi:NNP family nitrate/nitrite transporter-like MFS transporter
MGMVGCNANLMAPSPLNHFSDDPQNGWKILPLIYGAALPLSEFALVLPK